MTKFGQLLKDSLKSKDTEETLDIYFTRPIGLVFALLWNKLGVHPNVITIASIFFGIGAAVMFYHEDLYHNIVGVALLMTANFCDSTDGQMARLSGKKTLIGRMLDGFSGDVWFFSIYLALALRLQDDMLPYTDTPWGIWVWVLMIVAGFLCHAPQSSLSDYYRQIHLYFLKGKSGSELGNYEQQKQIYESLPAQGAWLEKIFYYNYAQYCHSQEKRTPSFQRFFKEFKAAYPNIETAPKELKDQFLVGSRPLMKYTNILTFNTRAICLYIACLVNIPWIYPLVEITLMSVLYIYMHKRHEFLCEDCLKHLQKINETYATKQ